MKKKKLLIILLLIFLISACKIESKNQDEIKLIKEDFDLDIMETYDGGNHTNFGAGVYSFKSLNNNINRLRLILSTYEGGNIEEIFDINLPEISQNEKLAIAISSNKLFIYTISEKKLSLITSMRFEKEIQRENGLLVWNWDDGGVIKTNVKYLLFASFTSDKNNISVPDLKEKELREEISKNKDISGLLLEISLENE